MFNCCARCLESICRCICKLYSRLWLFYYIGNLEQLKAMEAAKAKNQYLEPAESQLIRILVLPFTLVFMLVHSMSETVTNLFVADKYPNYLALMLKKDTKEHELLKLSLFYIFGAVFAILFFYTRIYVLQRMDSKTLALSLMVLGVCAFPPMFSRYGRALSLLVMPTSALNTMRAVFYSVLVWEVQRIAWANIDSNFERTIKTISCDKKAIVDFTKKLDFNFKVGRHNSKTEETSFQIQLGEEGDAVSTIVDAIIAFKAFATNIYRKIMYVMNGIVKVVKTISKFLLDAVLELLKLGIDFLKIFISQPAEYIYKYLYNLVVYIGTKIGDECAKTISMTFRKLGNHIKDKILDTTTIKYESNYVFNATASRNVSIKAIFLSAKNRVLSEHAYLFVVKQVFEYIFYSWIVIAFLQIFWDAISYIVLFLNVGIYDNLFVTNPFYTYDIKKQGDGADSIMPFYIYELALYVKRTGAQLNAVETASMCMALFFDINIALYTLFLFCLDLITFNMVKFVREMSIKVAEDFVEPSVEFITDIKFLNGFFKRKGRFFTSLKAIKEDIRRCAPPENPIDWEIYKKASLMLILLILVTIATPYIKRTRSYICERQFPERLEKRAQALYSYIKLQRVILKAIVNLIAPQMKQLIFQKGGEINPMNNDGATVVQRQDVFFLYKTWPFNSIAKMFGLVKDKPKCIKCPTVIDPYNTKSGIKCPNWECEVYYCYPCYRNLKGDCVSCACLIREQDMDASEESDSSADWD